MEQSESRVEHATPAALQKRLDRLERDYDVLNQWLENATDAIQISDRNLVTLRVNRAYEVLTGIKREELVGVPVAELVEQRLISESCGAIVARTRKPHTIVQHFYRTGRSAHVSCNPVMDGEGEIIYFICNDRDLDEISQLQFQLHQAQALNERYRSELETMQSLLPDKGMLVVEDKRMLTVLSLAQRVARVDSTALVLGETGVGKDEIAHFIHKNSARAGRKFVAINCGAITESLFESELFGHEPHAFTGAGGKRKLGLLEVANGGTFFLDEVGELSLAMQTKLLHVLQSQTFLRVGGSSPIQVDLRIIAATNADLKALVEQKRFREDLYYRLNVVPIHIPPLRERQEDIVPLARHFVAHYNRKYGFTKRLSPAACAVLRSCAWVGNVRELKNAIEQAVIMTDGDLIHSADFPFSGEATPEAPGEEGGSLEEVLERMELRYLNRAYHHWGSMRQAAAQLGMSPTTFLRHRTYLTEKYGPEG